MLSGAQGHQPVRSHPLSTSTARAEALTVPLNSVTHPGATLITTLEGTGCPGSGKGQACHPRGQPCTSPAPPGEQGAVVPPGPGCWGGWGRQGASQHSSGRSLSLHHWAVGPSLCPCDGRRTRGLVKLSKLLQVLQQWQGAGPAPLRACVLHRSPPSPERPGPQALGQCWCLPVWGLTP